MNDFLLALDELEKADSWNDDNAYTYIHQGISQLLSSDTQILFQLLYRIDIKENLVKEIFQCSEQSEDIIHRLTLLIIERLQQKAAIRRKYSSS